MCVFTVATSKHSPCKDAEVIWEMEWGEFLKVLDWVQFNDAREYAMTKDAHTPP